MVNEIYANAFCSGDISEIENFDEASKDSSVCWACHHRLEVHPDYNNSVEEMKMMGLYYHRPACELIFLKPGDHNALHNKFRSSRTKEAIASAHKGKRRPESTRQKMKDAWALSRLTGNPRGSKGMHWHYEGGHRVYTKGED